MATVGFCPDTKYRERLLNRYAQPGSESLSPVMARVARESPPPGYIIPSCRPGK